MASMQKIARLAIQREKKEYMKGFKRLKTVVAKAIF
jgi:hypothetical protein